MSTLHIELDVAPEDITGTAVDADGRRWPIDGWLSLIGIIDRARLQETSADPLDD